MLKEESVEEEVLWNESLAVHPKIYPLIKSDGESGESVTFEEGSDDFVLISKHDGDNELAIK